MGAVLTTPISSQLLQRKGNKNFMVGSSEMQGYRMNMEDTHCIATSVSPKYPNVGLFGVFDGHAGTRASLFLEADLHKRIASLDDPTNIDALRKATIEMDAEFCSREDEREDGSTCCYCVVHQKPEQKDSWEVIAVNVGDSRAMIIKPDGSVQALTEDHKPQTPEEAARIREAGGEVRVNRVDGQLAMSRAIGDWCYKSNPNIDALHQKVIPLPDIQTGTVQPGDVLLICCDGIVEQLTNEQVSVNVAENLKKFDSHAVADPALVMRDLLKYSLEAGSKDNHSSMLIMFQDGTGYHSDKDDFLAGPFAPFEGDKKFVKAYLEDAKKHGYEGEELMALAKKAEAEMPEVERQAAAESGGGGGGEPGAGLLALQQFLSAQPEFNDRLSMLTTLFGGQAPGEGEDAA